jgi:hypothetical protein
MRCCCTGNNTERVRADAYFSYTGSLEKPKGLFFPVENYFYNVREKSKKFTKKKKNTIRHQKWYVKQILISKINEFSNI